MPKYRVAELEGQLLDIAVALAEGVLKLEQLQPYFGMSGERVPAPALRHLPRYSREWAQSGRIIGRDHISVVWTDDPVSKEWCAQVGSDRTDVHLGATALIAAMRAYVCSRLGEEVELP